MIGFKLCLFGRTTTELKLCSSERKTSGGTLHWFGTKSILEPLSRLWLWCPIGYERMFPTSGFVQHNCKRKGHTTCLKAREVGSPGYPVGWWDTRGSVTPIILANSQPTPRSKATCSVWKYILHGCSDLGIFACVSKLKASTPLYTPFNQAIITFI